MREDESTSGFHKHMYTHVLCTPTQWNAHTHEKGYKRKDSGVHMIRMELLIQRGRAKRSKESRLFVDRLPLRSVRGWSTRLSLDHWGPMTFSG